MDEQTAARDLSPMVMTIPDVAKYLRFSEAKVYRMAQSGKIPAMKIGRAWRFKRELIDEWIKQGSERKQSAEVKTSDV